MRNLFLMLMILSAPALSASEQRVVLEVANMTCAVCPITVKSALKKVAGVTHVAVDYSQKTATVVFDPAKATTAELEKASTNAGYPAKFRK